ncbi:MAG: hypothetical protein E7553_01075 [Ruminococcaceae bacterium]|nr:hypothetical protein [Oscillospiraceae bacterium]
MKKTIKSYSSKVLAVALTVAMLLSCMVFSASAAQLSSVVATEQVGNISYAQYSGANANSYVMEFNPGTSGLMPMGYVKNAGWSATLTNQMAAAKADGYDAYGMINGEFFSMASGNHGTLTGRLIANGRILSDHETNNEYSFVIDKDAGFHFVQSQLSYHFYIEGKELGNAVIARINKRYNGEWSYPPLCYFDSACGSKTDTVSGYPGVEVVFNKLHGSELVAEGILEGEVVSVGTNTYGTAFSENQFVLYAHNSSPYAESLAALKAGQKVQIYAEELNDDAKEIMKKANTVMAATYPVVQNGKNCSSMGPMSSIGQLSFTERAQRTAIGVKADGSYVFFVSSGRASLGYGPGAGLTISEVGDAMIELGCVSAVNLDGGGSSTLNLTGTNKYVSENRAVGSVMMIVSRNDATTSPTAKANLNDWIYNANCELAAGTYTGAQKTLVQNAVNNGQAIYNDTNAMTGEFVHSTMAIREAMGLVADIRPKSYITLDADKWSPSDNTLTISNAADGSLVLNAANNWPSASYTCDISAPANAKIFYDITASAQASIVLVGAGGEINLNQYIAPNNLDPTGSGDIYSYGLSFKGSIDVSKLNASGLDISTVRFCTALGGAPSSLVVREFDIRVPYGAGDADGDYEVNSNDARSVLCHISGKTTLSGDAYSAADINGDGKVDTADIRAILNKSVGLG